MATTVSNKRSDELSLHSKLKKNISCTTTSNSEIYRSDAADTTFSKYCAALSAFATVLLPPIVSTF